MNKRSTFNFFKHILLALLSGILVGLTVGIYQKGLQYVFSFSSIMFSNKNWYLIVVNLIIFITLSFVNNILILKFKSIDGSSIPLVEKVIERKEDKEKLKLIDVPLTIINSYISTYSLFTLGSEGPSISIGARIGKSVNKLFKENDDLVNIGLSSGAGFGCAFLSPLSGIVYSYEEGLHKFSFKSLIFALLISFSSFFTCFLINNIHLISVSSISFISINQVLVIFIIALLTLLISYYFKKFMLFIRMKFNKYSSNLFIKFRSFIFFILFFILGYFIFNLLGNGKNIITFLSDDYYLSSIKNEYTFIFNNIYFLIGILVLRGLLLAILGNGKVSGGIVIPLMCIGGIIAKISILLFNNNINNNLLLISNENEEILILFGMILFFSLINNAPFTSLTLFIETLFISSSFKIENITIIFSSFSFYLMIIVILIMNLINRHLLNSKNIYEEFIKVDSIKFN